MSSLILRTATRFMLPLLLLFSVFLLFRGHNEPGGGFAGGLVAASAFALYALAFGVPSARQSLRVDPRSLIGTGLLAAVGSGLLSLVLGKPFLAHRDLWTIVTLPGFGTLHLGTPLVFDAGVYLVVLGVTLTIILPLAEEQQ
ncbi:MAG TPA: Na+/H+ antiporter subunit B [Pirellulaceae bacterium]|nr:Na+/H+ antiporter subunit B [Pirellulaceae bacterium]